MPRTRPRASPARALDCFAARAVRAWLVRFDLRSQAAMWIAIAVAAVVLLPFWPALVLAFWTGSAARNWIRPFRRLTGERHRAAAVLTVLTVVLIIAPLVALGLAVASDAQMLIERMIASQEVQSFLRGLVASSDHRQLSLVEVFSEHSERAWMLVRSVSSVAVKLVINLVVFIITTYEVLANGSSLYAWCERHGPLDARVLARLRAAVQETGRGLFFGVLGAGLIQGAAASIIFLALGVPRPVVLGFLTVVASIVPNLGSALVWGPVAAGLAFTGREVQAIVLVVLGVGVIGTIDNVFRPLLSRRAKLQLPAFLVLISMLGGILLIGAWGFIAGPLALRLVKEALLIGSEDEGAAPSPGSGEA